MDIYILIMSLCLVLAIVELAMAGKRRYRYLHFYLFGLISVLLFLVAGFRECGFDYENYFMYFQFLNSPNWLMNGLLIGAEPGYSFINYALGNYLAVIAVISGVVIWLQFRFIWKYSMLPLLTIVFYLGLYMYPSTMGQFRQAVALGLVLWAIVYRTDKIKFFLLIAGAMMFHFSAILGILVLFLPTRVKSFRFYVVIFISALVCSMTMSVLYSKMIGYMPAYVAAKLAYYASVETTALGLNTAVMIRAFVFFVCFYFRDKLNETKNFPLTINIYYLSLIIYTAMGFAPQIAIRGSIYFSFFEIILAANLIFVLKGWKKALFFGIFVVFSIYRQMSFFNSWEGYIPYKNWLIDYLT